MSKGGLILVLAWFAAAVGPFLCLLIVRRMLRVRRIFLAWGLAAVTAVAWVLGVWAFLLEPTTLKVRHVTIESATWSGPPVRIGVISDTHVSAPHVDLGRMRGLVQRMNAERPDVIVLLGDYTGGSSHAAERNRAEILAGVEAFGDLKAPLGVYGVLGNHDSDFDDAAIAGAMQRAGVPVLENRSVRVDRPGGAFWIAGLADMHSPRTPPLPRTALRGVPAGDPAVVITHWPDPFVEVPEGVALTLAGHTHCGQVDLPILGRLVHASPASERWPCGLYDEGGRKLFVTGGVGVSILPVRFRAPPELVIITLRAA